MKGVQDHPANRPEGRCTGAWKCPRNVSTHSSCPRLRSLCKSKEFLISLTFSSSIFGFPFSKSRWSYSKELTSFTLLSSLVSSNAIARLETFVPEIWNRHEVLRKNPRCWRYNHQTTYEVWSRSEDCVREAKHSLKMQEGRHQRSPEFLCYPYLQWETTLPIDTLMSDARFPYTDTALAEPALRLAETT